MLEEEKKPFEESFFFPMACFLSFSNANTFNAMKIPTYSHGHKVWYEGLKHTMDSSNWQLLSRGFN